MRVLVSVDAYIYNLTVLFHSCRSDARPFLIVRWFHADF